jgi:hypothetical protein
MAIGWLTILKGVPWGEVIQHAPAVADAAGKLLRRVRRKPGAAVPAAGTDRLAALEARVAELHEQMLASSELIRQLADQNAQLVRRLTIQRRWIVGLASATGALGLLGAALWAG